MESKKKHPGMKSIEARAKDTTPSFKIIKKAPKQDNPRKK